MEVEAIRYRKPNHLPGLEVLEVDSCSKLWQIYHETFTICTVLRRTGPERYSRWRYRRHSGVLTGGSIGLMEPGELHVTTEVHGAGTFRVLLVRPDSFEAHARDLGANRTPHWSKAQTESPALYERLTRFHRALESGDEGLESESYFHEALAALLAGCSESWVESEVARHPKIRQARDFIIDRHREKITLQELADVTGLSRFHLLRSFAAEYGLPPHAFQTSVRIAKAQRLLAAGIGPNELDLGFADQSHLIRHFRKIMGTTPSRYRALVRS